MNVKDTPSEKDSLLIAEKINAFYLRLYRPVTSNLIEADLQRDSEKRAQMEHKRRQSKTQFLQQRLNSNTIENAQKKHQERTQIYEE